MYAYGGWLPRKSSLVSNAYIVAVGDSITAFLGGLAVFYRIDHLSNIELVPCQIPLDGEEEVKDETEV